MNLEALGKMVSAPSSLENRVQWTFKTEPLQLPDRSLGIKMYFCWLKIVTISVEARIFFYGFSGAVAMRMHPPLVCNDWSLSHK